jgi:Ser/Thr protein kinase RdoA (MazF antagonist)
MLSRPSPDLRAVLACAGSLLGARPERQLFHRSHLSHVSGWSLSDGRQVVLKVRPPAARIEGCVRVHRDLWRAGLPCARPLAGPVSVDGHCLTIEELIDDRPSADPSAPPVAGVAQALARFVELAPSAEAVPSLQPPPAWLWWDHGQDGVWPRPDDRDDDLNARPGPPWLDEVGRLVRQRLAGHPGPAVIGHGDWEAQNLVWRDGRLHAVHDWDSVVCLPEAAVAGAAGAVFTANGTTPWRPTPAQTAEFCDAYQRARGLDWSRDDRQVCWAAGLWVRAFNTRKSWLDPDGRRMAAAFRDEATERLRLAGA